MSENHWELLILLAESFRQLEAVAEDAPHMTVLDHIDYHQFTLTDNPENKITIRVAFK